MSLLAKTQEERERANGMSAREAKCFIGVCEQVWLLVLREQVRGFRSWSKRKAARLIAGPLKI